MARNISTQASFPKSRFVMGHLQPVTLGCEAVDRSRRSRHRTRLHPGRHAGRALEALLRADEAQALPRGGLHDLPGLHCLDAPGTELLEPRDLRPDVVGLAVEVAPALSEAEVAHPQGLQEARAPVARSASWRRVVRSPVVAQQSTRPEAG